MRVHHILMVILIVRGISSFRTGSDAYPSIVSLIQRAPELTLIFDPTIFTTLRQVVEDSWVINREGCDENGGPGRYEAVKERLQYLFNEINSIVNITQVEPDTLAALSNGKWDTYFNHYCQKIPTLMAIAAHATVLIKSCLTEMNRNEIDFKYNSTSLSLKLLCHKDGNNTAIFMNNRGVECLTSDHESMRVCASEVLRNNPYTLEDAWKLVSFDLGLRECRDVEKLRNCTVTVLRKCRDPEPATALESLYDFYKSSTHCQSILESETSITTGDVAGGQVMNE